MAATTATALASSSSMAAVTSGNWGVGGSNGRVGAGVGGASEGRDLYQRRPWLSKPNTMTRTASAQLGQQQQYHHNLHNHHHQLGPSSILGSKVKPSSASASRAVEKDEFRAVKEASAIAVGDSSDDEDLAPIKLSAEARELLGEEEGAGAAAVVGQGSASGPEERNRDRYGYDGSNDEKKNDVYDDVGSGSKIGASSTRWEDWRGSGEKRKDNGSPLPQTELQDSGGRPQPLALGRDGSFFYKKSGDHVARRGEGGGGDFGAMNAVTPAPQLRTVRVNGSRSQTRSPPSSSPATRTQDGGSQNKLESVHHDHNGSSGDRSSTVTHEEAGSRGLATVQRSRRGDERSLQSTMRVKRTGKMTGTFLNGPLRRPMIRRQSEEGEEDDFRAKNSDHFSHGSPGRPASAEDRKRGNMHHSPSSPSPILRPASGQRAAQGGDDEPKSPRQLHIAFSPPAIGMPPDRESQHQQHHQQHQQVNSEGPSTQPRSTTSPGSRSNFSSKSSSARVQSMFKVPPPPVLPATHDQENEPPPTFKKSKPAPSVLGEVHKVAVLGDGHRDQAASATHSPQRKALAPRSQNTAHRAAPQPPPKMSVLEAATSNAGSARSKKKVAWSVNGKLFTRLDCIGRGGSSRVYRVMAENYKMFALKRVNVEDADAASIIGYRGEIDLLRRLEKVERVVRLFDYEINDDKGELKVLMEMGETDFNRMLNLQLKSENARFDPSFTRYYWREMLECVQAVHEFGIVHSDLKPANFLVVQGRLKIIDFGIANAIQDNTVNVHRENQIGTPNYMSPEALVDCNAVSNHGSGGGGPGKRDAARGQQQQLLKLGKPSDVWSLGCILYQMVYGLPPFGHIANTHQRIMSIPNPRVAINFPTVTPANLGAVPVAPSLIQTLKRCLDRDQHRRPTIPELLAVDDPFLNPRDPCPTTTTTSSSSSSSSAALKLQGPNQVIMDQPMLAQVLQKVIHYCRANPTNLPHDELVDEWAATFLDRIGKLDDAGGGGERGRGGEAR